MSSYDEHLISMAGGDGEFEKKLQEVGAKYAHMYVPRKPMDEPLKEFKLIDEGGDGDDPLEAADAAYTAAVQAAVAGRGDWASVQVAGHAVRQARAAKKVRA